MATFEELKAKLGDWLSTDTTRLPDSVRGDIINEAQRELLHLHQLRFGEFSDTFATVIGQQPYPIPTGFSRPELLWYFDTPTSALTEVKYVERAELLRKYPNNATMGAPTHYALWGGNILLGPVPNSVRTINREYHRILPDLVDGSPNNTNAFTVEYWEPILFRALALSTKYGIEDERAPMWEDEAKRHENRLIVEYAGFRSDGAKPKLRIPG